MLILSCNVGSTSLNYRLYRLGDREEELALGHFEGVGRERGSSGHRAAGGAQAASDVAAPDYATAIGQMLAWRPCMPCCPRTTRPMWRPSGNLRR